MPIAQRVTAVIPYYPYVRSDKKDQPRISITARLIADRYRDVPGFIIDIQNEPHLELPRSTAEDGETRGGTDAVYVPGH